MEQDDRSAISADQYAVHHAGAVYANFPGPVLVIDGAGTAAAVNAQGNVLLDTLRATGSMRLLAQVHAKVGGETIIEQMPMPDPQNKGRRWIEFTAIPAADGGTILLGRDSTYDINMRAALINSRQRYKDLAEIASDFVWEVDAAGKLIFVLPKNALGYEADSLLGTPAEELMSAAHHSGPDSPFQTMQPIRNVEYWVNDGDGHETCLLVSAVPLFDRSGRWSGARGVCRDVTLERLRDDEVTHSRLRDRIAGHVAAAIRNETRPQDMLDAAVSAICRAMGAAACAIFTIEPEAAFRMAASFGRLPGENAVAEAVNALEPVRGEHDAIVAGIRMLGITTFQIDQPNGLVTVWRDGGIEPWAADDVALLRVLADRLGPVLKLIAEQQRLEQLSRIDGLTGLLNRRAFLLDLKVAIGRSVRRHQCGALIFIDLDNFKPVNDRFGHDRGDQVLRHLADILHGNIRQYDLAGRFGGDEFVLWLDDIDMGIAERRAQQIIAACTALQNYSMSSDKPLGVSLGVAVFNSADDEDIDALIDRADRAMYRAKHSGKGRYEIAGPALGSRGDTPAAGEEETAKVHEQR